MYITHTKSIYFSIFVKKKNIFSEPRQHFLKQLIHPFIATLSLTWCPFSLTHRYWIIFYSENYKICLSLYQLLIKSNHKFIDRNNSLGMWVIIQISVSQIILCKSRKHFLKSKFYIRHNKKQFSPSQLLKISSLTRWEMETFLKPTFTLCYHRQNFLLYPIKYHISKVL